MSVNSASDIVSTLQNCDKLLELLENDLKSRNEVGFCLGENGTIFAFREGEWDQVTVTLPPSDRDVDERRIIVHTHPSLDATGSGDLTVSDSDSSVGEHPAVCGLVILSQEMFDVNWEGKALFFDGDNIEDSKDFRIECDGTTDGPTDERWVDNPKFN